MGECARGARPYASGARPHGLLTPGHPAAGRTPGSQRWDLGKDPPSDPTSAAGGPAWRQDDRGLGSYAMPGGLAPWHVFGPLARFGDA